MAREVQPDPWEPDAETCARVQTMIEDSSKPIAYADGETFSECLLCGEVDSHTDECPIPALRRWLES